jgi:hypothetical protein
MVCKGDGCDLRVLGIIRSDWFLVHNGQITAGLLYVKNQMQFLPTASSSTLAGEFSGTKREHC